MLVSGVVSLLLNRIKLMEAFLIGEVISLILIPIAYIKTNKIYINNRRQSLVEGEEILNKKINEEEGVSTFEFIELSKIKDKIKSKENSKIKESKEPIKKKLRKSNQEKVIEFKTKSSGKAKKNIKEK